MLSKKIDSGKSDSNAAAVGQKRSVKSYHRCLLCDVLLPILSPLNFVFAKRVIFALIDWKNFYRFMIATVNSAGWGSAELEPALATQ